MKAADMLLQDSMKKVHSSAIQGSKQFNDDQLFSEDHRLSMANKGHVESEPDSARNKKDKEREQENLAPEGKDKIELFDYLTHTMSLEIKDVQSKLEDALYPDDGEEHKKWAKFILVNAKKNEKD